MQFMIPARRLAFAVAQSARCNCLNTALENKPSGRRIPFLEGLSQNVNLYATAASVVRHVNIV
jgi:hypothetical protein